MNAYRPLGIVAVAAMALMSCSVKESNSHADIKREIENLGSPEFHVNRKAQAYLVLQGSEALPDLLAALSSSGEQTQKSMICYVIGEIDPIAYRDLLLHSNCVQNVEMFSKYFNGEAVKKLAGEDVSRLREEYAAIEKELPEDRKRWAQAIISALDLAAEQSRPHAPATGRGSE